MRQATLNLAWVLALVGAMILNGCGTNNAANPGGADTTGQTTFNNGSGNQPFKPVTHLIHRSIISNYFAAALDVVDTIQNRLTASSFPVGSEPTYLQASPDGTLTLVNNTNSNTLSSLNNLTEAVKTIVLGGFTESFVTSQSNKVGFAAVYNYSNGDFSAAGAIARFNPTDGSLNTAIPFPNVRYLAMDTAEKHLLAFTDVDDNAHWVDLTALDPVTQVPPYYTLSLTDSTGATVLLSRPVDAFFSADNSKAFVLSCGTECGGTSGASVTEIDTTSITPASSATGATIAATVVNQWAVNGARRGFFDATANKLYVAGSMTTSTLNDCVFPVVQVGHCAGSNNGGHNVQDGWFTVIDLVSGTASAPIRIGNGAKRWIRNIHGTFWVASLTCGVESCVSLVNPAAGTATVLPTAHGDATGISLTAIKGTSADDVYAIEGGELFIYDQKGNAVTSEFNTDVKGQASDVAYIN